MTPAEVIRHLFPSAYWGNPEWQEVKDVLAEEGLVVVSAEDLRVALNMLSYTNLPKRNGESALLRLNAALPERTETDA